MVDPAEEKPILSLLAEDPEERPRIEAFVLALSDSVDCLQDLEQAEDLVAIAARAEELRRQADAHGFPQLGLASTAVGEAAQSRDRKRVREAILDLTEISRRIRLGHRGAPPPGL
jgi:hypothetical protein